MQHQQLMQVKIAKAPLSGDPIAGEGKLSFVLVVMELMAIV